MALVLWNGIGDIGSGLFSCCQRVCTAPCRLVLCACKPICDASVSLCRSPFCLYVSTALLLNVPPVVLGLMAVPSLLDGCLAAKWLIINVPLCLAHIAAAWYVALSVANLEDPRLLHKTTTIGRAVFLLCYDPWIACYLVVVAAFFVWMCVGLAWRVKGKTNNHCHRSIVQMSSAAIAFGYFFCFVGFAALCLSLCFACFDRRKYQHTTAYDLSSGTQESTALPLPSKKPAHSAALGHYGSTVTENDHYGYKESHQIPVAVPVSLLDFESNDDTPTAFVQPPPSAPTKPDTFGNEEKPAARESHTRRETESTAAATNTLSTAAKFINSKLPRQKDSTTRKP